MNPIYNIFVYGVWFFATFYLVALILFLLANKKKIYDDKTEHYDENILVTMIVPAYNEESKIDKTINSLKKINHKNIEFLIINDGSLDRTSDIVKKHIKGDSRFKFIDNKENKGKAAVLNQGTLLAKGKYVSTMDADSMVEPDIMKKVLPYFDEENVGAVTVTVEIEKPKKFLHKLIQIEFIIGLSLFLKITSLLDAAYVTPGPFSIYNKKILKKIGLFDSNNITEDLEIAYRIHKSGYKIKNCAEAKVSTFIPESFKGLYVQRRRWYSGAIQTLYQHREMLFNKKYGFFGYLIPYNYILTLLGLVMFGMAVYLELSKFIDNILYLQYTNFDIWARLMNSTFDILALGNISFIGASSLIFSFVLVFFGLKLAKKKLGTKKLGILTFPFMFFLYQIFWIGSIITVIRGKRIKWR